MLPAACGTGNRSGLASRSRGSSATALLAELLPDDDWRLGSGYLEYDRNREEHGMNLLRRLVAKVT